MTESKQNIKTEKQSSALSDAGEISQGVHLGCGGHALGITVILVLAQIWSEFYWGLAAFGVLQILYVLPSIRIMRNLGLGRNVLRGFIATAILVVMVNVIGLLLWKYAWPAIIK